jgi:hypothetical protein
MPSNLDLFTERAITTNPAAKIEAADGVTECPYMQRMFDLHPFEAAWRLEHYFLGQQDTCSEKRGYALYSKTLN